jgi:hypothetical protein
MLAAESRRPLGNRPVSGLKGGSVVTSRLLRESWGLNHEFRSFVLSLRCVPSSAASELSWWLSGTDSI